MTIQIGSTTRAGNPLIDGFGRTVSYLRISVTDRCDLRCQYCMSEHMQFLPRSEVLSFEEIETIAGAFIARGVTRLRLTGGEPLVRRDIIDLVRSLGRQIRPGRLAELTLTTNGTLLRRHAGSLFEAGVRRINVSLDSLEAQKFATITRRGTLSTVLDGIAAAREAGLKVKINMVALAGINENEIEPMLVWAHGEGMDLTLIEGMPLGETGLDRADHHLSLRAVRDRLAERYTLERLGARTGGPARYDRVHETGGVLGYITPMSHNFCESCNRVRLTATGQLVLCLGQEDAIDLRGPLREGGLEALDAALDRAMLAKPKGHDFVLERAAHARHMSVTGG